MTDFQDLLTTKDICKMFDKSAVTINTWRLKNNFPTIIIPGSQKNTVRFDKTAVKKWARAHGKSITIYNKKGESITIPNKKRGPKKTVKSKTRKTISRKRIG